MSTRAWIREKVVLGTNLRRMAMGIIAFWIVTHTVFAAATADSPQPASAAPVSSSAEELARAYREMQQEWRATREGLERNRRETENEAQKQSELLGQQLARLEKELEHQKHEKEQIIKMVDASNMQTLIYAATFVGIALVAVLSLSLFQLKATTKLTALAVNSGHERLQLSGASVEAPVPALREPETRRLMDSFERLEQRILQLESGTRLETSTSPATASVVHDDSNHSKTSTTSSSPVIEMSDTAVAMPQLDPDLDPRRRLSAAAISNAGDSVVGGILGRGEALLQLGQAQAALNSFEEALKIEPQNAEAWVKKGSALEKMEKMEEALSCYDRAIELDRGSTLAYLYKGGVCNRLERFDEALACYEKALKSQEKPQPV